MFRRIQLTETTPGALFLHSMPARYEEWDAFSEQAREMQIDGIVCLTGMDEIREKSPDYAAALEAGCVPCPRASFPLEDYGVPDDWEAFARFVRAAVERIQSGERVLVHCAGGVGRTGMFAVCLLHYLGIEHRDALAAVALAGSGPEAPDQEELALWHTGHVRAVNRESGDPKEEGE
ncbi:MAG: phosphatase [Verrucomicrobia bacterium]|nr:phosphatase [Verrucomicrobiota bacterium]